jgi:hypothetical protein
MSNPQEEFETALNNLISDMNKRIDNMSEEELDDIAEILIDCD